jgi:hypothetical protein
MKILLEYFNSKVGKEDIFKPRVGNDSVHEISNNNGVQVISTATLSGIQCSHITTFINTLGLHLMGNCTVRLITS